jgi:hypothetical protein
MRKPTIKEIKMAIDNILGYMGQMHKRINNIEGILNQYIIFKKDDDKFEKILNKKMMEEKEKYEQSKVSKSSSGNKKTKSRKK